MNKERIGAGGREGRSRRNVDEGGEGGGKGRRGKERHSVCSGGELREWMREKG